MKLWTRRQEQPDLPLPPMELRELVGPTDPAAFSNPTGGHLFPNVEAARYRAIFDFGCGCGRIARQLAQQHDHPEKYIGVDVHKGMIAWCVENLSSVPGFTFYHHDVYSPIFNTDPALPRTAPLPVEDGEIGLFLAWSVFTHLLQSQIEWYIREMSRALAPDGLAITTWFLFDKRGFPMMQDFQNALYINEGDLTNAVIFDKDWLLSIFHEQDLVVRAVTPPAIRGFQWVLHLSHRGHPGDTSVPFPADDAPIGRMPPPVGRPDASTLGT